MVKFYLTKYMNEDEDSKEDREIEIKKPRSKAAMKKACQALKEALTTSVEAELNVDSFNGGEGWVIPVLRSEFEEECRDIFDRMIKPIEDALT